MSEAEKLRELLSSELIGYSQEVMRLRGEVERAYRRGAEAMREAALKECGYWQGADRCADQIRVLPIPEDK